MTTSQAETGHAPATRAVLLAAGATLAMLSDASHASAQDAGPITDADILTFALNLEYLEAEYYLRGVAGVALGSTEFSPGAAPVQGGRQVPFQTPALRAFADSVMRNELAHVRFLRGVLGSAVVAQPPIDFNAGFAAVAQAAGLGPDFDPFADEGSFFLGAFLFEDVGVTAYHGAAPLIRDKKTLTAAAGIHAVEAYHAGMVRSVLFRRGPDAITAASAISAFRRQISAAPGSDYPIAVDGRSKIVPVNGDGVAPGRTPQQVLRIVYGTPQMNVGGGAFFPNGVNGRIRST